MRLLRPNSSRFAKGLSSHMSVIDLRRQAEHLQSCTGILSSAYEPVLKSSYPCSMEERVLQ